MATYPTLTIPPSYPLDEEPEDDTLRGDMANGVEITRTKWTRSRTTYTVNYDLLPTADKNTLMTFVITTVRRGADSFTWTHPVDNTSKTVKFVELPKPSYVTNGYWQVSFRIREV